MDLVPEAKRSAMSLDRAGSAGGGLFGMCRGALKQHRKPSAGPSQEQQPAGLRLEYGNVMLALGYSVSSPRAQLGQDRKCAGFRFPGRVLVRA
jgi:predicted porin